MTWPKTPIQRELPVGDMRRLGRNWRARRVEIQALERELMLARMAIEDLREENRKLRGQLERVRVDL